jgi:biopolymer transport protein ExbD
MAATQRDDVLADINMTPLVDVMLVLLVVMMVTASTVVTRSLAVELPAGKTGQVNPDQLTVTLTKDGNCLIDESPVSLDELRARVRSKKAESEDLQALIAADGGALHERVVEVLDLLRDERVTKVAIGVTEAGN